MSKQYQLSIVAGVHEVKLTAKNEETDTEKALLLATNAAYKEALEVFGGIIAKLPKEAMGVLAGAKIVVPELTEVTQEQYESSTAQIAKQQKEFKEKAQYGLCRDLDGTVREINAHVPTPVETVEKEKNLKDSDSSKQT